MKIITVTWFCEDWEENCIAPISSCLGVLWMHPSHQSRGCSSWRRTWFWKLHYVSLPELCLVARRRQGLANFSFALISGCYKCKNRVFMSLTILCISTVSWNNGSFFLSIVNPGAELDISLLPLHCTSYSVYFIPSLFWKPCHCWTPVSGDS